MRHAEILIGHFREIGQWPAVILHSGLLDVVAAQGTSKVWFGILEGSQLPSCS